MHPSRFFAVSMLTAALTVSWTNMSHAQSIEKMKQFKVANTDLNLPTVPQEGRNAAAIRENLKKGQTPRRVQGRVVCHRP